MNDQAALYQELMAAQTFTAATAQDEDRGAGAVLVGGTGIAEVILSVDQRLESLQNKSSQPSKAQNRNTSSAIPLDEKEAAMGAKRPKITAVTPSIRSMVSVPKTAMSTATAKAPDTISNADTTRKNKADEERMGFAAFRGMDRKTTLPNNQNANSDGKSKKFHQRTKDDRAFSQFVKRQLR
jgi:hypothetical protein